MVTIVGVGDAGGYALNRMVEEGVHGVQYIAVNTNRQALWQCKAENQILIGETILHGLGAGGNPDMGKRAILESITDLHDALNNADKVYVVGGMGGGTGSGVIPIIVQAVTQQNIELHSVVSTPFTFEGLQRKEIAERGISLLKAHDNNPDLAFNDHLLQFMPDKWNLQQAFHLATGVLAWKIIMHLT